MPTPMEDLYAAAKAMIVLVDAAASHNVTQAASNYGLDFRVPPGHSVYQIQIFPQRDHHRATVKYPRAEISVAFHHYRNSLANEEAFQNVTLSYIADEMLDETKWTAQAGIYDIEPDTEPTLSQGAREGNVITVELSAVVLMDAV